MKLRQRPHKSPLGVKFKFSEEHSLRLFHMEAARGFQMSTGSDGVMERRTHNYNLEKIFCKLKRNIF